MINIKAFLPEQYHPGHADFCPRFVGRETWCMHSQGQGQSQFDTPILIEQETTSPYVSNYKIAV